MDVIKRASFASKQIQAGPAPLASFEDLPSDELESPEDVVETPAYSTNVLEDESGCGSNVQLTTPDSLTISSQSTPRIECDTDSQFTLTPGDPFEGQSSSELRTISLSSLSKENTLNVDQKKGSAVSLGAIETVEPDYTQRKGSWTDIFRSHNQNTIKTSSSTAPSDSVPEKTNKKKSKIKVVKNDLQIESKSKEKGRFLSIFKKKSNKSVNSLSPDEFIIPIETLNITEPEDAAPVKVTNGCLPKGKENELPNKIELSPTFIEEQNDLDKVNFEINDKIPDERRINRKIINICEKPMEKEYNIFFQSELNQLDKVSKSENIEAIVHNIDHESSESELAFEDQVGIVSDVEKKEDDNEAEVLIAADASEFEDDHVVELKPICYEIPKQISIPSRQQRLEVTTKPIDRPRSTTPINASSLEAFIHSVSPTFQTNVEKIKLSLPGEQFLGRVKSPKKTSIKSWSDFCEKGLSPQMYKRIDIDDNESSLLFFQTPNISSENAPISDLDTNWAAFESESKNSDSNRFSDNFNSMIHFDFSTALNDQTSLKLTDPYQPFETSFPSCSCDCHKENQIQFDQTLVHSDHSLEVASLKIICSCKCQLEKTGLDHFKNDFFASDNLNDCDVSNVSDESHSK